MRFIDRVRSKELNKDIDAVNMVKALVIGYGNTLRGDDAVGYLVAEEVESWNLPDTRSLPLHQLTPELAADMAEADAVYFVDAWQIEGDAQRGGLRDTLALKPVLRHIEPVNTPASSDHAWTPNVLMQMAQNLYDAAPIGYQILIPAVQFEYGEKLSAIAQQGLAWSLRTLKVILDSPEGYPTREAKLHNIVG